MKKTLTENEIWELKESLTLTDLSLAKGAEIRVPEGKQLTMTVDGVHCNLDQGTYSGDIVLSVTDSVVSSYENHGTMEWFHMNVGVSIHDGKYCPAESVAAAVSGEIGDGAANHVQIRSQGDMFGGIYVDGKGSYEINDADIELVGNGGSDAIGYGAAIAVRGDAEVTINRAKIHNAGSIRTALQVCANGKAVVNDSEFTARDLDRPNYVMAMSKAPWMLGIHGRVRTTNIQDYGQVEYHRCKVTAENWGAMSTDGTKHVRLRMYDSEIRVTGSGYGAYSIGDCHDYFDHCTITVPDYGVIQCSSGRVTYTGGTIVEAGRSAVMMHSAGAPGLLLVNGKSQLHSAGPVFQVKGRGADILVDDASLASDSGVLLEIIENDDPNGRGMHMGPETVMDVPPGGFPGGGPGDPMLEQQKEGGPNGPGGPGGPGGSGGPGGMPKEEIFPVKAIFRNTVLTGDVIHCYSDQADALITLSGASLTGRITTAVSNHPQGMPRCKEAYALIGRVETFPCPRDTEFGLKVTLENGAKWTVTGTSYLTDLTIEAGAQVDAVMTVNGASTALVPGTYSGKIVLSPKA